MRAAARPHGIRLVLVITSLGPDSQAGGFAEDRIAALVRQAGTERRCACLPVFDHAASVYECVPQRQTSWTVPACAPAHRQLVTQSKCSRWATTLASCEGEAGMRRMGRVAYEACLLHYAEDIKRRIALHGERRNPPIELGVRAAFKVSRDSRDVDRACLKKRADA